ncbi:MAG TPA: PIG-L family deacetylase [Candidatus Saccharimonadales bacterium]|nr:PIG-L family deacetylase [Candidatus Saccharimonadales bacterium]
MAKTVILSPHFDDAVIDCFSYLVKEPESTVITVCAKIPPEGVKTFWDTVCGERDSHKMVKIRRIENDNAINLTGSKHKQVLLDYYDSQYDNGPVPIDQMCADILANSPKDSVFLAPIATSRIFQHKNHKDIRNAGLKLLQDGYKVWFYPDSPYMNLPRTPYERIIRRIQKRAEMKLGLKFSYKINELSDAESRLKDEALRTYKSQYRPTDINSFGGLTRVVRRKYELVFIPE